VCVTNSVSRLVRDQRRYEGLLFHDLRRYAA